MFECDTTSRKLSFAQSIDRITSLPTYENVFSSFSMVEKITYNFENKQLCLIHIGTYWGCLFNVDALQNRVELSLFGES